jgi:tetrahydromethanopterin S-methyltransferase subunit A
MAKTPQPPAGVETELRAAMAAKKCRRCGCFQNTISTLEASATIRGSLETLLAKAQGLFEPKRYDCLGCEVCWPAVAQNLASELDPAVAAGSQCATAEPTLRTGWPPLPGDYRVLRYQAPVAVCTLNSDDLVPRLAAALPPGLAIVGSLHTENLGIEHIIRNLLPNPHVRFLVVCGEDARKAVGHLPGQSLVSLMREGLDENARIRGALGKRPLIKNIGREQVDAFRCRVRSVDLIGTTEIDAIAEQVTRAAANDPGPSTGIFTDAPQIPVQQAVEPKRLTSDPAGYLVIYPDRRRDLLVLEHYADTGVLTRVIEGTTPMAICGTVIAGGLITQLDHAAYLGRELTRAEAALRTGEDYVQDRAPGEVDAAVPCADTGCGRTRH